MRGELAWTIGAMLQRADAGECGRRSACLLDSRGSHSGAWTGDGAPMRGRERLRVGTVSEGQGIFDSMLESRLYWRSMAVAAAARRRIPRQEGGTGSTPSWLGRRVGAKAASIWDGKARSSTQDVVGLVRLGGALKKLWAHGPCSLSLGGTGPLYQHSLNQAGLAGAPPAMQVSDYCRCPAGGPSCVPPNCITTIRDTLTSLVLARVAERQTVACASASQSPAANRHSRADGEQHSACSSEYPSFRPTCAVSIWGGGVRRFRLFDSCFLFFPWDFVFNSIRR